MEQPKPIRLLFLDMMRFIALFMMIQGHTVYAMLDKEIRDGDSTGIGIWTMFRGYTAPFFMVIAGAVFTFLLLQQDRSSVSGNFRIRKGLVRVGTLLFWGYLLRFQFDIFFGALSQSVLENSLSVDVLHIIGLGLLVVIGVFVVAKKYISLLSFTFLALFFTVALSSPIISTKNFHPQRPNLLSYEELGVQLEQNNFFKADSLGNHENQGVLITAIRENSRAQELGLQVNDVIIAMGWQPVCSLEEVPIAESRQRKNHFADLDIVRGKKRIQIPYNYEVGLNFFPEMFTFWMNSVKTKSEKSSPFPIFPWLSYLLFGGFFGALLAWSKDAGNLNRFLELKLLVLGGALIALSEINDYYEIQKYGVSNFWGGVEGMGASASLIFHRIGVVILVGAFCAFLSRFIKKLPPLLNQMSRNTLWLYVGHLIILYVIRPMITLERFSVGVTLVCVVVMYGLMIGQTLMIEKKNKLGSWSAYLNFVSSAIQNRYFKAHLKN